MHFETYQLVIAGVAAALLGYKNLDKLKGLLGGILPAAKTDPTADRVMLALQLRAACEQACPKAIEHIDAAIPHLLPGHVEVAK